MRRKVFLGSGCVVCAVVLLTGCFNVHIDLPERPSSAAGTDVSQSYVYETQAPTAAPQTTDAQPVSEQPATQPAVPVTAAPQPAQPTQPAVPVTEAPKTPDKMTPKELLDFFNASLNRVKAQNVGFTKHKVTSILDLQLSNSMANALVGLVKNSLLTENGETTAVAKGQSGVQVFSPTGKNYISNLTTEDLTSITCTANGGQYVIRLAVKGETNPGEGSVMSRGFDYITVDDVVNIYAPKVGANVARENIQVVFSDCTATLTVNADGVISAYSTYVKGVMNMNNASIKKGITINTDLAITLASTTDYSGFTY